MVDLHIVWYAYSKKTIYIYDAIYISTRSPTADLGQFPRPLFWWWKPLVWWFRFPCLNMLLVGGFKHLLFFIRYGMSSFPLTFIFSRWLKPPTRLVKSIYDFPHAKTMWNLDFSGWSTGMVRVCRLFRVVRLGKLSRFASFLRDRFESEVRSRWHGHGHGKTRKSGHELKGKTMFGHHITDKICEHIWFDLICVLKNSCDDRATLFFERDGEMLMF